MMKSYHVVQENKYLLQKACFLYNVKAGYVQEQVQDFRTVPCNIRLQDVLSDSVFVSSSLHLA
jgi:hypothetical protein